MSIEKKTFLFVFQNYNLFDYLTPVENVRLGGKEYAIARALASNVLVLLADEIKTA